MAGSWRKRWRANLTLHSIRLTILAHYLIDCVGLGKVDDLAAAFDEEAGRIGLARRGSRDTWVGDRSQICLEQTVVEGLRAEVENLRYLVDLGGD